MTKKDGGIFERQRLRPPQMRTVADRRFADAECLRKTGQNQRANGAMYLGGFVIECLLKAKLLEKHKWLQSAPGDLRKRSEDERALHALCYRQHDLDGLLVRLPNVTQMLARRGLLKTLQEICGSWTVFARYSPRNTTIAHAKMFLADIRELKKWLS